MKDPTVGVNWQLPDAELHWVKPDGPGHFSGRAATDGSVLHPSWPRLRAGGWAVVVFNDSEELEQGL